MGDPACAVDIDQVVNNIGRMVNSESVHSGGGGWMPAPAAGTARGLGAVSVLVTVYTAAMVATVAALAVLAFADPRLATQEAWGHALIVTVLALVLLLRLRSARAGSAGAVRALGIIAAVLLVVNAVEAALPGAFPGWMRIEMVAIAFLMVALLVLVRRRQAADRHPLRTR
jgi:hypothetical protein